MSPEQNLRQALIDSVPREHLIAMIAQHLYRVAQSRGKRHANRNSMTPQDWYSASLSVFRGI